VVTEEQRYGPRWLRDNDDEQTDSAHPAVCVAISELHGNGDDWITAVAVVILQ